MSEVREQGPDDAPVSAEIHVPDADLAPPAGVFGLGAVGLGLAARLVQAGVRVLAAIPDRQQGEITVPDGVEMTDLETLGRRCSIVLVALRLGEEKKSWGGLLDALAPGSLLVDFSPDVPHEARELAATLAAKGLRLMDAVDAPEPDGMILVGGTDADFGYATAVLEVLGTPLHTGPVGTALALGALLGELEVPLSKQELIRRV